MKDGKTNFSHTKESKKTKTEGEIGHNSRAKWDKMGMNSRIGGTWTRNKIYSYLEDLCCFCT